MALCTLPSLLLLGLTGGGAARRARRRDGGVGEGKLVLNTMNVDGGRGGETRAPEKRKKKKKE